MKGAALGQLHSIRGRACRLRSRTAFLAFMQKRIIIYVAAILLVLRSGYAYQQPRDSHAILTETPAPSDARIAYGKDPNQFGELRLPKGTAFKKPYPVVVMLHGGCWMAEYGLGYMGRVGADLAAQGSATWNLEYRRVGNPGGGIVGTFHDVQLGVGHLETLAKNYPLDLQRVVIGHSAGGHLALRLANTLFDKAAPKGALRWRGVVALAAITDLRRTGTACDASVQMLMGGTAREQGALYAQHSPLDLLPLGAIKQIIVHGDADRIIPTVMATSYVEAAQKKGDDAKLMLIEKAGHFDIVDAQATAWAQVRAEILKLVE